MSATRPWQDEETLRHFYIHKQLSSEAVGGVLGCGQATVSRWLGRNGIESRSSSGEMIPDVLKDPEKLRHELVGEGKTPTEIADEIGYRRRSVSKWIQKHELKLPHPCPNCPQQFLTRQGLGQHHAAEHGETIREYEGRQGEYECGQCDRAFDTQQALNSHVGYRDDHSCRAEVPCAYCGESVTRREYHISLQGHVFCRGTDCHPKWWSEQIRGEDHPRWNPDTVFDYGTNWHEQRKKAIERDSRQCQGCGVTEADYLKTSKIGLDVHHIRPISTFEAPEDGNVLPNLITLCRTCHRGAEQMAPLLPSDINKPAAD